MSGSPTTVPPVEKVTWSGVVASPSLMLVVKPFHCAVVMRTLELAMTRFSMLTMLAAEMSSR